MKKLSLFFAALSISAMAMAATFTKVTSAPTDWTGEYVLVYEHNADTAFVWTGADSVNCYVRAEISKLSVTGDFVKLKVDTMADGYKLQIIGGINDGMYISSATNKNGLSFNATTAAVMTITLPDTSVFIKNAAGAVMRYNKTSNQMRFRYYKTTSYTDQQIVQLYKLVKSGDPVPVTNVSFNSKTATVKEGKTAQLTYTIAPDSATDKSVSFESLNKNALTVSPKGVITGVAENAQVGVVITALDSLNKGDKFTDTCWVEVQKADPLPTLKDVNTIANLIACYDAGVAKQNDLVKVTGYISKMLLKPTNFAKYGSITVWLSSTKDGVGTNEDFQLYNCYGQDGDTLIYFGPNYTAIGDKNVDVDTVISKNGYQYAKGDSIVAYGKITKYNKTYELTQGCYFVSGGNVVTSIITTKETALPAKKIIVNGQLVIIRDEKIFNVLGAEL